MELGKFSIDSDELTWLILFIAIAVICVGKALGKSDFQVCLENNPVAECQEFLNQ